MKNKKLIEELLDEQREFAFMWENNMGRQNEENFAPNNPDYIAYKTTLKVIEMMGYDWVRNGNKHKII